MSTEPKKKPDEIVETALPEAAGNDPWRMVKIKLHRDKRSGKGLYVNVNNHNYFIPRGEAVEVPAFIAAVIENSAKQDEETARLIDSLTESADF